MITRFVADIITQCEHSATFSRFPQTLEPCSETQLCNNSVCTNKCREFPKPMILRPIHISYFPCTRTHCNTHHTLETFLNRPLRLKSTCATKLVCRHHSERTLRQSSIKERHTRRRRLIQAFEIVSTSRQLRRHNTSAMADAGKTRLREMASGAPPPPPSEPSPTIPSAR